MARRASAPQSQGKEAATVDRPAARRFRFGYLVHDVSRTRRTLIDHFMKPLGITRSQWSILSTLSRSGNDGMMQVDLARLLEVGKVSIGGLVDRLEASGHVERRPDPSDRRVKRVFITAHGWEMISKMIVVAEELNELILQDVSAEELEVTESVLMRVKNNVRTLMRGAQGADAAPSVLAASSRLKEAGNEPTQRRQAGQGAARAATRSARPRRSASGSGRADRD